MTEEAPVLRRKLARELLAQPLGELGLPGLGETLADHRALPREDRGQLDRLRADRRPVEAQQLFGLRLVEVFRVDLDQLLLEQRAGEDAHERAADLVPASPREPVTAWPPELATVSPRETATAARRGLAAGTESNARRPSRRPTGTAVAPPRVPRSMPRRSRSGP